jgi:hypothetical protein
MQSPLIFGNGNGQQSNYNNLAQYLASPPGDQSSEAEVEKKKWMLATGLGGMFTPGKFRYLPFRTDLPRKDAND